MANIVNWLEIPATDIDRASKFYSTVLDAKVEKTDMGGEGGLLYAFLPMDGNGVGGALAQGEGYEPSTNGTLIYLNGGDDLSPMLARVEDAGGKVVMPKTSIGENGFMAIIIDTEGNKIGLHSQY